MLITPTPRQMIIPAAGGVTRRSLVSPNETSGTGTAGGLEMTNTATGKSSTWTFMCWLKWDGRITLSTFFASTTGKEQVWMGTTVQDHIRARCNSSKQTNSGDGSITPSSWHHVCVNFGINHDSTVDVRLYLDGTSLGTVTNGDSILELGENNASYYLVQDDGASGNYDGRLFDVIMIEGSIVAPTSGNYSTSNGGEWQDYTGSFGSNGFRIDGQNASDAGEDSSGNGLDFSQSSGGGDVTLDDTDVPPGANP